MSPGSKKLLFLAVLVFLLHGCGDNNPAEPEGELTIPRGFSYDYETDDAMAVSMEFMPGGEQVLDCVGPDGTTFSLAVGPGAVSEDVTVTITPLKYLTVTAIDASGGSAISALAEAQSCNVGALFEPDGLTFDSTVVLTVTFSGSSGCDVTDDHRIISIDPSLEFYDILPTDADTDASALACTLSHFSLKWVDDPRHDRLQNLIEVATWHGQSSPSFNAVTTLLHYRNEAESHQWDDLVALANKGGHDVLLALARVVVDRAIADLSDAPKSDMLTILEYRQLFPKSGDIETVIVEGMRSVIAEMVSAGTQLCGSGSKDEGKEMLENTLKWLNMGAWYDSMPSVESQIRDEIERVLKECGPLTILIEPFEPELYDIAISESDDNTHVTFEIEVIVAEQYPLVGASVGLSMMHEGEEHYYRHIGNGTTDDEGMAYIRYVFGPAPANSAPQGTYALTASVHHGGEVYAGSGRLYLRRRQVRLTYEYTYNYAWSGGDSYHTLDVSFDSDGAKGSRGNSDCGPLNQSLAHYNHYQGGTSTYQHTLLPYDPPPSGCYFNIRTRTVFLDDGYNTPIFVLDYVSVPMRAPVYAQLQRIVNEPGYAHTDTILVDVVDYFSIPYPAETEVRFVYPSGMDSYHFEGSSLDGYGHGEVRMSCSVEE